MSDNTTKGDYMLNAIKKIHLSGDSYTDIQTLLTIALDFPTAQVYKRI